MVYNKIDLNDAHPHVKRDANGQIDRVWLSAHSGAGVDLLLEAITERLSDLHTRCLVDLPASNGKLRANLYARSLVREEQVSDDGSFRLELELSKADYGWLEKQSNVTAIERL
jgi:GTP-binding protein HflX